jgi:transposase
VGADSWKVTPDLRSKILDLWAQGLSGSTIKQRTGVGLNTISKIITKAREAGDQRAQHHKLPGGEIIGRKRSSYHRF